MRVDARRGPRQVAAGDVEAIEDDQDLDAPVGGQPGHEPSPFVLVELFSVEKNPAADRNAAFDDRLADGLLRQLDDAIVTRIGTIGGDPELEHARLRDHFLDGIDLRLVDLRNDHLKLIEAVAADGDFLLPARIDAPGHGRDEFVHVDRGLPPLDFELDVERLAIHWGLRQTDLRTAEIELRDVVDERLPSGFVGRLQRNGDPAVGLAGRRAEPPLAVVQERFDLLDRILDLPADLFRGIDFIDEDHPPLEVDAKTRRPPQRDDRQAGDERREHGGQPPPHVGDTQRLGEEPSEDRRDRDREERRQQEPGPRPPPREGGGGRSGGGNIGGCGSGSLGEGEDEGRKHGSQTHFRVGTGFGGVGRSAGRAVVTRSTRQIPSIRRAPTRSTTGPPGSSRWRRHPP